MTNMPEAKLAREARSPTGHRGLCETISIAGIRITMPSRCGLIKVASGRTAEKAKRSGGAAWRGFSPRA